MSAKRALVLLIPAAAAVLSLYLISRTPIYAITWAAVDDGLFVRLGMSIRETGWLGPFDDLTLAKGMAYPILLALADLTSIPAKMAEHLVYLSGAAAMGWVSSRLSGRPVLGVVLFVALALDPVWSLDSMMRIRRETMYAGTGMLLVAGVTWVFLVRLNEARAWRLRDYLAAILVGLGAGTYWLVREEGIWLAPTAGLIVFVGVVRAVYLDPVGSRSWLLVRSGLSALALVVGFVIVIGAVLYQNSTSYGVAVANDFREGAFPRAVGAFSRIEEDPSQRYVQVSRADLQAAYDASPAAAELEPHLSNRVDNIAGNNCKRMDSSRFVNATGVEVECDAPGYAWFPWELRRSIGLAGYWDDGGEAQAFLDRLAEEINGACADGRLTCGPPVISSAPPVTAEYVREAIGLMPTAFDILGRSRGPLGSVHSLGQEHELRAWSGFLRGPLAPVDPASLENWMSFEVAGFVASPVGTPAVRVAREGPEGFSVETAMRPDPEVFIALTEEDAASLDLETWTGGVRYTVATDCMADDCVLVVEHGDGAETEFPLWALETGWTHLGDGTVFRVATVNDRASNPLSEMGTPRDETILHIQRSLDRLYSALLPLLTLTSLVGCALALLLPPVRSLSFLLGTLTVASGIAVLARFGLIGLLEVAAWPGAMTVDKLSPASPFLITFAVLGSYLLLQSMVALTWAFTARVRQE